MAAAVPYVVGGLIVGNTAMKYSSQKKQAKAAKAEANYEAGIHEQNADIADAQARDATERGKTKEGRFRQDVSRLQGSQRARLAAQGIDIDTGSAGYLQSETAVIGEVDALTIRNNAAREAWGFKMQAVDARSKAQLTRMGGGNRARALRDASYSTLISGATDLATLKMRNS